MSDEGTAPQDDGPVADEASAPALASEISRRVGAILDAVEREATRLREEARGDAARYLDDARRQADALVDERRQRIAELSDELVAKSEAVVSRLDDAEPVRDGFENLVRALGDAAERLADEADPEAPAPAIPPAASAAYEAGPAATAAYEPAPAATATAYEPAPAATATAYEPAPVANAPAYAPPTSDPGLAYATPYPPAAPAPPVTPPVTPSPPAHASIPEPAHPAAGSFREQPHPARPPSPAGFAQPRGSTWRDLDDARVVAIRMASAGSTRAEVDDHLRRTLGIADPSRTLDEVFGPGSGGGQRVPWTGTDG